jgi:hypothetical protein
MAAEKKWYGISVREHCEKKVIGHLSKRKIEFFYPLCPFPKDAIQKNNPKEQQGLFPGILFIHIPEWQFLEAGRIKNVISFLYWLNKPAVIDDRDIAAIAECLLSCDTVWIEPSGLGIPEVEKNKPGNVSNGNHTRICLPTLGYTLVTTSLAKKQNNSSGNQKDLAYKNLRLLKESTN